MGHVGQVGERFGTRARFVAGALRDGAGAAPFSAVGPATDLGPLISHAHRDRVAAVVRRARGYPTVVNGGRPAGPPPGQLPFRRPPAGPSEGHHPWSSTRP
jgi:hypothetical protein